MQRMGVISGGAAWGHIGRRVFEVSALSCYSFGEVGKNIIKLHRHLEKISVTPNKT